MAQLTLMPALYLTRSGSLLARRKGLLVVRQGADEQALGPLPHLTRVVVFGHVLITPPALDLLLGRGIAIAYCTVGGHLKGVLRPPDAGDTATRLAQAFALAAPGVVLARARDTVFGKVAALRVLLAERQRRRPDARVLPLLQRMQGLNARVQTAPDLDALRGLEGAATAAYYTALAAFCRGEVRFPGTRSRRPPRDPFNAVLSFLYTLLVSEAADALVVAGLDPALGFLHARRPGRPSLACDLMEPFRPLAADRLALHLFNHLELKAADFTDEGGRGVRLAPDPLRRLLAAWEAHLDAPCPPFVATILGAGAEAEWPEPRPDTLRVLLHRHARALAATLRAAIPLDALLA